MKKILFTCVFVCLILYSCFFPETVVEASKNGILIWFEQILPALLPFTILSSVLLRSHFLDSLKGNANLVAILITMVCGFVFGFPIGAKLSSDFYKNNMLTEKQATLLAITTNNFSPMYVCGFALPLLFASNEYNVITYLFLYFLPLFIAAFFLILTYNQEINTLHQSNTHSHMQSKNQNTQIIEKDASNSPHFQLNMQIMDESILNGFIALIKICGYIVFFSILTQILMNLMTNPPVLWQFFLNNMEITNGITALSKSAFSDGITYILAIQLLSFGGMSGLAQTASLLEDANLSMHKYIIGKVILSLFLTLLSVIYVCCFILQL